ALPLDADGQNACDLALRGAQPGTVVECAGRGLEAEVEQLLAALAERPLKLVVCHVAELPSFQRDQPLSSRSWSSPATSGSRAAAPPWRAAPGCPAGPKPTP